MPKVRMLQSLPVPIPSGCRFLAAGSVVDATATERKEWLRMGICEDVVEAAERVADLDGVPPKTAAALASHEISISLLQELKMVERHDLEAALTEIGASSRASNSILAWLDGQEGKP